MHISSRIIDYKQEVIPLLQEIIEQIEQIKGIQYADTLPYSVYSLLNQGYSIEHIIGILKYLNNNIFICNLDIINPLANQKMGPNHGEATSTFIPITIVSLNVSNSAEYNNLWTSKILAQNVENPSIFYFLNCSISETSEGDLSPVVISMD